MKNRNNKETILVAIIGAVATITVGFFSYQEGVSAIRIPINATQAAETRQPTVTTIPTSTFLPIPIQTLAPSSSIEERLLAGDVPFVWQWAGENWYGRVTLSEINGNKLISQANMGLIQKTLDDAILMNGKVFSLAPGTMGTFVINDDGSITIDLAIEKKSRRTGLTGIEIVSGTLEQTLCYSGTVSYAGNEGRYNGDIVLVYDSSSLGSQVDEWFKNNPHWFDKHVLDR